MTLGDGPAGGAWSRRSLPPDIATAITIPTTTTPTTAKIHPEEPLSARGGGEAGWGAMVIRLVLPDDLDDAAWDLTFVEEDVSVGAAGTEPMTSRQHFAQKTSSSTLKARRDSKSAPRI